MENKPKMNSVEKCIATMTAPERELLLAFANGMQAAADLRRAEEPQRRGE